MNIKPSAETPSDFEDLLCDLVNKGYDVWLTDEQTSINIFLGDYYLQLKSNGKWTLE